MNNELQSYDEWIKNHKPPIEELSKQREYNFNKNYKISLVVPVYNTVLSHLTDMFDSVLNQTYSNWEICVTDGYSDSDELRNVIIKYATNDIRIKYDFLNKNLGISKHTNNSIDMSSGEYIAFLDSDDMLYSDALYEVVKAINEYHEPDLIYTDSDHYLEDKQKYGGLLLKTCKNPILSTMLNYIIHLVVIKKEVIYDMGLLDSNFDRIQDHDITFKIFENNKKIYHIPKVLYTWRQHSEQTNQIANKTDEEKNEFSKFVIKCRKEHLKRLCVNDEIIEWYYGGVKPIDLFIYISVIIPFYGGIDRLKNCIGSLYNNQNAFDMEIIIINFSNIDEDTKLLSSDDWSSMPLIKIISQSYDKENIAEGLNYAAHIAQGNYLLFLNSHTLLNQENILYELIKYIHYPMTGAAGCKINYMNEVDHVVSIGGQEYIGSNYPLNKYFNRKSTMESKNLTTSFIDFNYKGVYNVSSITDAFCLIKKDIFDKINGFNKKYPLTLFMMDFCLRLNKLGYYNIVYGSANINFWQREHPLFFDAVKQFSKEKMKFEKEYSDVLNTCDPFINPNIKIY